MMRISSLLVLALAAVCDGILPEIIYPGVEHFLEDHWAPGHTEPGRELVEVEQLQEAPQQNPQDATHPVGRHPPFSAAVFTSHSLSHYLYRDQGDEGHRLTGDIDYYHV